MKKGTVHSTRAWVILVAVLAVIVFLLSVVISRSVLQKQEAARKVSAGVSHLQQMEKTNTAGVESQVANMHQTEEVGKLTTGTGSIWKQFRDYAILGDSRAVDFSQDGFLESSRVLAKIGVPITDVKNHLAALKALNPARVFLIYGLNDIESGNWNTTQAYNEELGKTVSSIKQACPRATVYVNSILLVQDPAYRESKTYYRIPEYNAAMKTYCAQNKIPYIDNDAVCKAHTDQFEPDGIHYKQGFYEYWAKNIITEVIKNEKS